MRILVVDDDRVFREELSELLREEPHEVVAEPSVAKALETLRQREFDVVLTDLKMPRQTGIDLLREVRGHWPRTYVVMITGFATVETALEAMKLGAFDYVRKPFRIEQIREILQLVSQEREFEAPSDSRRDPAAEASALAEAGRHEVLFLRDPKPASAPHVHAEALRAEDLVGIGDLVKSFVAEHANAAVVLADVERLAERHRLEDVVALLDRCRTDLAGHGPLRVGLNPRRVSPTVAIALGTAVAADETHATLEALANPIRRKVLQRLAEAPASFGEAMRAAGIDDSPKMSFHLRRLVESGLVRHEGEHYALSTRGHAGLRLLQDATFLPPAAASENLAFARRPGGSAKPHPLA